MTITAPSPANRPGHHSCRRSAAVAAMGGLLATACAAPPPPPAPPVVRPVHTATVQATAAQRTRTLSGTARTEMTSSLSFKVTGTITRLAVAVGDRVRAGDPIAELDPVDYELRMQEAEAAFRQAEARAVSTRAELRRARSLYENADGSRAALDAATAAADMAAAEVASLAKRVELAERQLAYTRLSAPEAGVIASVGADVNEYAVPGLPIVVLASGAALEVEFAVPETLIGRIQEGSRASAAFDAIPDRRFEGTVTEVGVMTTATRTTFPATVRLDDVAAHVRSGMTADITIAFADEPEVERFVVPTRAVISDRASQFVFVADTTTGHQTVARRRSVTVGGLSGGGVEVVDGLSEGEIIVTAGASRLQDGDQVRFDPILLAN